MDDRDFTTNRLLFLIVYFLVLEKYLMNNQRCSFCINSDYYSSFCNNIQVTQMEPEEYRNLTSKLDRIVKEGKLYFIVSSSVAVALYFVSIFLR